MNAPQKAPLTFQTFGTTVQFPAAMRSREKPEPIPIDGQPRTRTDEVCFTRVTADLATPGETWIELRITRMPLAGPNEQVEEEHETHAFYIDYVHDNSPYATVKEVFDGWNDDQRSYSFIALAEYLNGQLALHRVRVQSVDLYAHQGQDDRPRTANRIRFYVPMGAFESGLQLAADRQA